MRATRGLFILFVLALSLAPFAMTVEPAVAAPATPKVSWSKCYSQFGPFECGTVQVPLDYDQRNGAAISLAVVRLPAADPSQRIGSLFLNPGGPGESGVDFVVFASQFLFPSDVLARFDIVGFDPRGIGRSTALRCFGNPKQWGPYFTPFAFPMTPEEEQLWIAGDRYLDAACDQRGGKIADHMSTANVARDLDMLRQAVGDQMLTYAGYSYGSYLGATYANMFPNKVRALIVDGVLDPIAWSTGRGNEAATLPFSTRLHSDIGAQATLDEFFRLCDAGGPNCAFSGDAAGRFAALADRLLAEPINLTFPDGSQFFFDYSALIGSSLGAMYDSFSWADFAQFLADIESFSNQAQLAAQAKSFIAPPAYITKRGFPTYPNLLEGFPSVACSDSVNPDSYAAWSTAGAQADADNGYFGRIWTWASAICAEWPHADSDRYMGPFDRETANPVLVIGNLYDPATPYHGAQVVADLLPNSALLTLHGWGHTSLGFSQCVNAAVAAYLINIETPAPGTVCEQDFIPFANP
jgi:pimeloyl-ACP methyl ester carboxylesterase